MHKMSGNQRNLVDLKIEVDHMGDHMEELSDMEATGVVGGVSLSDILSRSVPLDGSFETRVGNSGNQGNPFFQGGVYGGYG